MKSIAILALGVSLQAQTLTPLHDFVQIPTGDGNGPQSGLVMDVSGNLYGTTIQGGAHGGDDFPYGYAPGPGTVFKITPNGTESLLYSFGALASEGDGANPASELVIDQAGNLYGTAELGGSMDLGVIFRVTPSGVETVLHNFSCSDGAYPIGGLVMDGQGNIYGTASEGGAGASSCSVTGTGSGVIFELSNTGQFSILHNFVGSPSDASDPTGTLLLDSVGNLYGMAGGGANGNGCVFELAQAVAAKITPIAPSGSQLGMAGMAGTTAPRRPPIRAFKSKRQALTASSQLTLLYSFNTGESIASGKLLIDAQGNLYGATSGRIFKLQSDGQLITLHTFMGVNNDGYFPTGGLVMDKAGNLFGTTSEGGLFDEGGEFGTLFEIAPDGQETILYNFGDDFNAFSWAGEFPNGDLMIDGNGNIYGTCQGYWDYDEATDHGTVFKFGPVQ